MIEILFEAGAYVFTENFPAVPRVGEKVVFDGSIFVVHQVYYYHTSEGVSVVVKIGTSS